MAISFDLRARKTGNRSSFSKALQLYESCIDLFSKTSSRCDVSGIVAAASNNKARIFFEHCDFEGVGHELERLQRIMFLADKSPNTSKVLEEEDFQGILLNLLLLRPPTVAQAA
jgi:hypothetical protein